MQDQTSAPQALPAAHTVPTHLALADTVLSLGALTLSSRQLLLLLLGGSIAAAGYTRTEPFFAALGPAGAVLHIAVLVLASLIVLALTFGQAAGRSLDVWVIVVLAYLTRPRLSLWHSLREGPLARKDAAV